MLSTFGPGWFYNVFGISVELENAVKVVDDGEMYAVPWFSYNGQALFISTNDFRVHGKVKIVTHNSSRSVWHMGVVVTVEEYIHLQDPFVSVDVKKFSTTIAEPQLVNGEATYSLNMDLHKAPEDPNRVPYCRKDWCSSFNGRSFAVRHVLHVEVLRPWYTFSCNNYTFLSLQCPGPQSTSAEQEGHPCEVSLSHMSSGGKCIMKLASNRLDVGSYTHSSTYGRGSDSSCAAIRGSLRLSTIADGHAVTCAKLQLIRVEDIGDQTVYEKMEFEHLLFGVDYVSPPADKHKGGGIKAASSVLLHRDDDDDDDDIDEIGTGLDVFSNKSVRRERRDTPCSRGYIDRMDIDDEAPRFTDPVKRGSIIRFEIPLDGYTHLPDLPDRRHVSYAASSSSSSAPASGSTGFSVLGELNSHEYRIQRSLWSHLYLHPSFSYVPLVGPPGSTIDGVYPGQSDSDGDDVSCEVRGSEVPHEVKDTVSLEDGQKVVTSSESGKDDVNVISLADVATGSSMIIYPVQPEESVSLRYFFRLVVVEETGRQLWTTQEITFFDQSSRFHKLPAYLEEWSAKETARSLNSSDRPNGSGVGRDNQEPAGGTGEPSAGDGQKGKGSGSGSRRIAVDDGDEAV